MTDEQVKRLRELAERALKHGSFAWHALRQREFRAAASPDVLLALLDERDTLRRERDEAVVARDAEARMVDTVARERDAALALMRDFYEGRVDPTDAKWCNAVDALLGGGEADKN